MSKGDRWKAFFRGFRAVMPFWLVSAPFTFAYATTALQAGWQAIDIQAMSLLVYSGPTQLSAVDVTTHGLPMVTIMLTAVAAHLHVVLYGVSLTQRITFKPAARVVGAFMLTDAAYGVTISTGAGLAFLIGAEVSLYFAWNASTLLGLVLGQAITIPAWVAVSLIAPLMYLVMMVGTIKVRAEVIVAAVAAMIALVLIAIGAGSFAVAIGGVGAALIGAGFTKSTIVQRS